LGHSFGPFQKKWLIHHQTVFEKMARISVVNPFRKVSGCWWGQKWLVHQQTVFEKGGSSVVSPAPNCKLFKVLTARFQENMITRKQKPGGPMFSEKKPGKHGHPPTKGAWKMWFVSCVPCSKIQALRDSVSMISKKHVNKKSR
jgi:hypothetical protein